jgi:hypothetical protein
VRAYAVALVLFGAGCRDCSTELHHVCRENFPCWPGPDGGTLVGLADIPQQARTGACLVGNVVCDADDKETCEGVVLPSTEVCNDEDDDCDGVVDNGHLWFTVSDSRNDCVENLCGACAAVEKVCRHGDWVCEPLHQPSPEVCDGIDNDCNCIPDDGIDPIFDYPYDRFPDTVGIGECRPSVITCRAGEFHTQPAVTPRPELCNGRDDDCDGIVDDVGPGGAVALVINVDLPQIEDHRGTFVSALIDVLCGQGPIVGSFAVIEVAEFAVGSTPWVRLDQDFADAATTCNTIADAPFAESDVEDEYVLTGMRAATGLDWPDTLDHYVWVFTDEASDQFISDDVATVEDDCDASPYRVGLFLDPYEADMDAILAHCGGFKQVLGYTQSDMEDSMRAHLGNFCD